MRVYLLKWGLQIEVPVKFMVYYKFPNLINMTHIFPIKKGTGSFEKSQQYHWYDNYLSISLSIHWSETNLYIEISGTIGFLVDCFEYMYTCQILTKLVQ